jgi:uncharacterized protein YdhG (YjbR/CyaY superfamily)
MAKATTVDEQLAALPPERRAVMESLRAAIRAGAPAAEETIAYDMPAYRTPGGRFVVSFASFKAHYSLFPASDIVVERLGDEIRPYLAGRGTIRFPAGKPVPLDLVRRVVEIRVEETADRAK